MSGAQELDPDDFIPARCPQCGEFGRPGRLDQHIAKKHADLPPCTASITNEHTNGTIRCVFRVGHRDDEYGDYHAGPYSPDRGRHWWADHAEGAIPHASPNPSEAERNIVHGLYSSGIRTVRELRSSAVKEKPRASVIEIVAPDYQPTEDGAGSIVVPRELRINGQPVYTPRGSRIQINDFDLGDELVTVTLTLVARRIVIGADGDGDLEGGE